MIEKLIIALVMAALGVYFIVPPKGRNGHYSIWSLTTGVVLALYGGVWAFFILWNW